MNKKITKQISLLILINFVCFLVSCSKRKNDFSKQDIEVQESFIELIDLTLNTVDKNSLIDSIKTIKLPNKEQIIKSYENGGYVEKKIKISEEERRIYIYHDIMALINVRAKKCFLPSSDHNFTIEDFIFNIEPCLGGLYPKIKDKLWDQFPKKHSINYHLFTEINNLLSKEGAEMGIVHLYDDQFYFIFFEKRNKNKVYSVFDRLGIQIGDHNTLFKDYKPVKK